MLTKLVVLGAVCLLLGSTVVPTHAAAPRVEQAGVVSWCDQLGIYLPPICGEQSILADQETDPNSGVEEKPEPTPED